MTHLSSKCSRNIIDILGISKVIKEPFGANTCTHKPRHGHTHTCTHTHMPTHNVDLSDCQFEGIAMKVSAILCTTGGRE